jgi:hypothetical protein
MEPLRLNWPNPMSAVEERVDEEVRLWRDSLAFGQPDPLYQMADPHCPASPVLGRSLLTKYPMPKLWSTGIFGRDLALRLRVYVPRTFTSALSDLSFVAAPSAVLPLRTVAAITGAAMRLTPRCINLLRLLRTARWLTTSQVHRRFFSHATSDAVRKRLRKLTADGYLVMVRQQRMSQALFTLGREGKRILEGKGAEAVNLERKPPAQIHHFSGINDLRIAAELGGCLSYFFACWELPGLGWRQPIIPDGIFTMKDRTFALEFDRGVEGVQFFVRTKIAAYQRGLDGVPLSAVLIVTDSTTRMASLANAIGDAGGRVLFSTLDLVRLHGFLAPVFYVRPDSEGIPLV